MSESLSAGAADPTPNPLSIRRGLVRRLLRNPSAVASAIVLLLVVLAAAFAGLLAPYNPDTANLNYVLAPPGAHYLLGGDSAGRDVLSRLLYATRFSLAGAAWTVVIALVLGVTSGLIAGYYQKWFSVVSEWAASVLQALPGIVVLLAARAVLGPSIWLIMAVFGVIISPVFYRLTYAGVTSVRKELYIDAAKVAGISDRSIIGRHVLAVIRAPIIIMVSLIFGVAIAIQSGLDFLGLGDDSLPTWGGMLSDAFSRIYVAPTLLIWPSSAIAITSIALVLLGNAIRDELQQADGHTRRSRRKSARAKLNVPDQAEALQEKSPSSVQHSEVVVHDKDAPSSSPILKLSDLRVGYDRGQDDVITVVRSVSLNVGRGEVHGLIGESGSGKTQTAWSILGLLPAGGRITEGSIEFDGVDLVNLSDRDRRRIRGKQISYIPQEPMTNLDPSFTVGSQLVEPMRVQLGVNRAEARNRALELLNLVGIAEPRRVYSSRAFELSGGMAQRVLIAGAVSCDPKLLIADEPTTALDVTVQAEILDLLRTLQRELSLSVLLVTHNFGVVADLCDRVSVMQNGRIVETGPVESIFSNPSHPYTQSLFAAILEGGPARGPLGAEFVAAGGHR